MMAHKAWILVFGLILAFEMVVPNAKADEHNEQTELTFTASVEIPGAEAILKWYYPGQSVGQEFVYSRQHERDFARDAQRDVWTQTAAVNTSAGGAPQFRGQ